MRRFVVLGALALLAPASALAAAGGYKRVTIDETGQGLAVAAPLDEYRVSARARVITPDNWTRLSDKGGQPRFRTGGGTCRYVVTWAVQSRVDDDMDATAYLDKALDAPAHAHVYEDGIRNGHPFRVIKDRATPPSSSVVRGTWVAVLTRRKDIAPAGKVVWAAISATARSAGECHSGTVHNAARAIADGMSVATATLRFKRK